MSRQTSGVKQPTPQNCSNIHWQCTTILTMYGQLVLERLIFLSLNTILHIAIVKVNNTTSPSLKHVICKLTKHIKIFKHGKK